MMNPNPTTMNQNTVIKKVMMKIMCILMVLISNYQIKVRTTMVFHSFKLMIKESMSH